MTCCLAYCDAGRDSNATGDAAGCCPGAAIADTDSGLYNIVNIDLCKHGDIKIIEPHIILLIVLKT